MNFGFSFCREIFCWEIGNVRVSWIFNIGRGMSASEKERTDLYSTPEYICTWHLSTHASCLRDVYAIHRCKGGEKEERRGPGTGDGGGRGRGWKNRLPSEIMSSIPNAGT